MGEIFTALVAVLLFFAGQALVPMSVIDGIVNENARFLDGGARLFGGEGTGFIEINSIETGIGSHFEALGEG